MLLEDLLEYYEYIVLLIISITLIITLLNVKSLGRISKYFSNKQFQITSIYEIDPISLKENFTIGVFNNNVNDSRIVSLGIFYKNRNIDYFNSYLKQENLGETSKVVVPSRDSIRLKINCDDIKKIIRDLNKGKKSTEKIYVYVIDSLGMTTMFNSKAIRKNIQKMIQKDIKGEKLEKKAEQQKLQLEKKKKKQEESIINKARRIDKWNDFKIKLKAKIKKRK